LVRLAGQAAPFRSLVHPDDPRFFSPGGMADKIRSFCAETNQPIPQSEGEIVRCILESLALRYRQALEQAEKLTRRVYGGLHMVGGGIQNELLCRFTANAIGKPVWAGPVEASAIGNMLMQLVALGECKDLKEARELVAASFPVDVYEPEADAGWVEAYGTFLGFGRV
jgi:rhamnulokinase